MSPEQKMVQDFHEKFCGDVADTPRLPDDRKLLLRSRLIVEEASECVKAASNHDMIELIDALCDLLYVTYGTAVVMGVDLAPFFVEVQRSNMSKEGGHDAGGKVMKGKYWSPPNLQAELTKQFRAAMIDDGNACLVCDGGTIKTKQGVFTYAPSNIPGGVIEIVNAEWLECSRCRYQITGPELDAKIDNVIHERLAQKDF